MKKNYPSFLVLVIMAMFTACKKEDSLSANKTYKVDVTITSQVYTYQGTDANGYSWSSWETSGSNKYSTFLNDNDSQTIDFPATVTSTKIDDNTINIKVQGDRCCLGPNVNCTIGSSGSSGYIKDDCGRSKINVAVTKN